MYIYHMENTHMFSRLFFGEKPGISHSSAVMHKRSAFTSVVSAIGGRN